MNLRFDPPWVNTVLFELEAGAKWQINLAIDIAEIDFYNPGAWAITGVPSEGKHSVR